MGELVGQIRREDPAQNLLGELVGQIRRAGSGGGQPGSDRLVKRLRYSLMPGRYAVCKLGNSTAIPDWALQASGFCSITRTGDELSIVCAEDGVPAEIEAARGWVCLKLEGPFAFSETGILSSFLAPLAENEIGIFAISTFETDYVLIRDDSAGEAFRVLDEAGHQRMR